MNKTYSINFIDRDGINIKFNLKYISINELKCIYFKLSFDILSNIHNGKMLSLTKLLNEKQQLNHTIPADEVINELKTKYMLNDWQVETRIVFNKVKIILVIPDVKDNVDLLVDDMSKFGYYLSYYSDINHINSEYLFLYLYFEPNYTDDVTNRVKRHGVILHLTPGYNLENILKDHKLIPKFGDRKMKYPDRIYFITGDLYEKYILQLAKDLNSESSQKTNEYLEIKIDTDVLPDNVKFYVDPNYELGIYTYDEIPFNCVCMIRKINLLTGKFVLVFPNIEKENINESINFYELLKDIPCTTTQELIEKLNQEHDLCEYEYYLKLYETLILILKNEI